MIVFSKKTSRQRAYYFVGGRGENANCNNIILLEFILSKYSKLFLMGKIYFLILIF